MLDGASSTSWTRMIRINKVIRSNRAQLNLRDRKLQLDPPQRRFGQLTSQQLLALLSQRTGRPCSPNINSTITQSCRLIDLFRTSTTITETQMVKNFKIFQFLSYSFFSRRWWNFEAIAKRKLLQQQKQRQRRFWRRAGESNESFGQACAQRTSTWSQQVQKCQRSNISTVKKLCHRRVHAKSFHSTAVATDIHQHADRCSASCQQQIRQRLLPVVQQPDDCANNKQVASTHDVDNSES